VSVCPTNFDEKVECPFVDRKEFIEAFENAFRNIDQKNYSILVYYGVAGIGKTSLRKELPTLLEKHNESNQHTRVIWTSIDFATEQYRQPYKFFEIFSSKLHQKYGIKFNSFDIALATYLKKINPHSPLVKENYSEDSIVRDVLDICDEFVPVNLIPNVYNLAKSLPERYQKWALKRKEDISKLPNLEPTEIYEQLPVYLAHDLTDHLQNTSESAVIFIDTYEALWEKERDKGRFNSRDEWLRKLIENIQKSCMWVICGREKLRWEEVNEDWKNYLDQHKIGKLPEKDAFDLLKQCGITEEDIQKILIESSEGVPYYLELSIDIYRKIKQKKKPTPGNFAKIPSDIFCRFVKYLDRDEKETLKVLSVPRYWNRELFKILIKKFNTGYPATSFSELHRFSFMDIDEEGKCSMHQLMRKSLQDYQDQDLKKEVHNFMLDFYSNQLKDLDIKAITLEHEIALIEAFYHAKEALEAEELCEWFISVSDPFDRAAFWQLITPMYEEMLQILEAKLEPEHPDIATTLNDLALLYKSIGEYEKILPLYQRALNIYEQVLDPEHPFVATIQNNLAGFYKSIGKYEKALLHYKKSLDIRENVLDPLHPDVAITLNNLAELYRQMGEYEKALPLCQRALDIRETVLGPEHPSVAATLNNLAGLYYHTARYEEALPLLERSLKILERKLGSSHPNFKTTEQNSQALKIKMEEK
jgi:tetratricopeptide (TPR) repeat protein